MKIKLRVSLNALTIGAQTLIGTAFIEFGMQNAENFFNDVEEIIVTIYNHVSSRGIEWVSLLEDDMAWFNKRDVSTRILHHNE